MSGILALLDQSLHSATVDPEEAFEQMLKHTGHDWPDGHRFDYRWNHSEIRRIARKEFSIWHEVRVERRRRYRDSRSGLYSVAGGTSGWHTWHACTHELMVVSNLPAAEALKVLAHELRHAWQWEQFQRGAFADAYAADADGFEADADDFAERRWRELIPIVKFPGGNNNND